MGCPDPYLALQPLSGAKNEVCWFNAFDSQDELNSVGEAYKTKQAWYGSASERQQCLKERDGTRYEILMANSREEAERAAHGKDFVVLEVVPRWSFPAREWVDRNREMWKAAFK